MANIFQRLFTRTQWFIAYRRRKPFTTPFDTTDFNIIMPPPGKFYADPFLIKHHGRNYIFFEEYCFVKSHGVISFIEIYDDATYTQPQPVLERKYHLSYPFMFSWNNQIYMIPESSANHTVELYVAANFPYDWKLAKTLLDNVQANDTTLFFAEGKVWLFTNMVGNGQQPYTDLCLFYADSLWGEWQAHPGNPVVSDITCARPAGNLFCHHGAIIRPGQNSLVSYGHSFVFNQILSLTATDYREFKLTPVEPHWYPGNRSCHTYNANEDFEVMDGEVTNRELMKPWRKIASGWHHVFGKEKY